MQSLFCEHTKVKLEIGNRKKIGKPNHSEIKRDTSQ